MKTKSKVIAAIATVSVLVGGAWLNGYTKASQAHRNGTMSLFTVGLELLTMNSISAHGYQTYLEGVVKQVAKEKAIKQAKVRKQKKIAQIGDACLGEIGKATDSTVSLESEIVGNNTSVWFTVNIWKTDKLAEFVCNYKGNVITKIEGNIIK